MRVGTFRRRAGDAGLSLRIGVAGERDDQAGREREGASKNRTKDGARRQPS
jgi:hypothetical protein